MTSDEQAIRDLALWHRATASGDVDTVLGLMAAARRLPFNPGPGARHSGG
jgi:hypothetical protein